MKYIKNFAYILYEESCWRWTRIYHPDVLHLVSYENEIMKFSIPRNREKVSIILQRPFVKCYDHNK